MTIKQFNRCDLRLTDCYFAWTRQGGGSDRGGGGDGKQTNIWQMHCLDQTDQKTSGKICLNLSHKLGICIAVIWKNVYYFPS